jgi:hypothetical protein
METLEHVTQKSAQIWDIEEWSPLVGAFKVHYNASNGLPGIYKDFERGNMLLTAVNGFYQGVAIEFLLNYLFR